MQSSYSKMTLQVAINLQNLTDNERYLLETLRSLQPFERIEITADAKGKVNNYLVIRSRKVFLADTGQIHVQ